MKKFWKSIKKIDYRHYIAFAITLGFLALSVFCYRVSFYRITETGRDLWSSLKYYVMYLFFNDESVNATVINKSAVDFNYVFPIDFEGFKAQVVLWFYALFSKGNLLNFLLASTDGILVIYTFLLLIIALVIIFKHLLKTMLESVNVDYGTDTKALKRFKKLEQALSPIFTWIKDFISFCFNRPYKKIWLVIWLYNLNIFTMLGELVAYTFYVVASFDFVGFYVQVYKLFFDIAIMFSGLPFVVWCFIAIWLILIYRKKKAFERLNRMECKNTGFVKSLPTVNVIYGLMGGGKGQIMTDFALTAEKIFRSDAKDIMTKYDLMFPHFKWSRLESHLKSLISKHVIFSLATTEQFVGWKKTYFYILLGRRNSAYSDYIEDKLHEIVYGYDFDKYGLYYDNELYVIDIFEAIETYAKAYYIYTSPEFKITNYAIRSDGKKYDNGNLPLWDYNFFARDSKEIDDISKYGKILDQDILRRGKKVNENNPLSDTFEFGIICMTELDKERGNQNVTKEMKISADETNQKNDLFNFGMKLDRHSSTVDYIPFIHIFFDLQRVNSTNADLQELGQHIGVGDKEKDCLCMPLFFIEEFIYGLIADKFDAFYDDYRYYHGNNTLFMYLIKKVCGKFINYYRNIYNMFGYDLHHLDMENVTTKEIVKHDYYLMYKKNHAKRFYTDSLVDYFRKSALKKDKGLIDYPEYANVKATREELLKQNAYFIQSLENVYSEEQKEK